jgi:hypothetical protein
MIIVSVRKEHKVKSEVAQLRQQIELESVAMKLAMYGFATVAKHEFITHKYDTIGTYQEQLSAHVGEQQATQITVEVYTRVMEQEGEQGMQGKSYVTAPLPLHHLSTPPMIDEARELIKQHGCEVFEHPNHCVVMFPEGTMRREIFPRLSCERYEITLPDGFQMVEMDDRWREHSLLFLLP